MYSSALIIEKDPCFMNRETRRALEKHCDEYLEDEWAEEAHYRLSLNQSTHTKLVKSLVWNYSTQSPRWGAGSWDPNTQCERGSVWE